jgi:sec-independent protein translocase protein TatA
VDYPPASSFSNSLREIAADFAATTVHNDLSTNYYFGVFMFLRDLLMPTHLLVLLALFLLFFGSKKLPEFGKGLGDGIRSFKESTKGTTSKVE